MSVLIKDSLSKNGSTSSSNSSGSTTQSTKQKFEAKLAKDAAQMKMKSQIEYSTVLTTTSGSSSKGGTSNSKSKQHPYLISLDKFVKTIPMINNYLNNSL